MTISLAGTVVDEMMVSSQVDESQAKQASSVHHLPGCGSGGVFFFRIALKLIFPPPSQAEVAPPTTKSHS